MGTKGEASLLLDITMGELTLLLALTMEESPEPGETQYASKAASPKSKEDAREALSEETLPGERGEPLTTCIVLGGAASLTVTGGSAGGLTTTLTGRKAGVAELALADDGAGVAAPLEDSGVESGVAEELALAEDGAGVAVPLEDSSVESGVAEELALAEDG